MTVRHPGCHGILVSPAAEGLRLGWSATPPPRRATVVQVAELDIGPEGAVWTSRHAAGDVEAVLWRAPSGILGYSLSTGVRMEVDLGTGTVRCAAPLLAQRMRAVATVGLAAVAQHAGALVLHAAAAARGDAAILLCALSGQGKSTQHVRLLARGLQSVSDDVCAVDLDGDAAMVWPGAAWARIRRGSPLPAGLDLGPRFDDETKQALDLDAHLRRTPCPVAAVVLLERVPAGTATLAEIPPAEAIPRLSAHAPWLLDPDDGPAIQFRAVSRLVRRARCLSLRVPEGAIDAAADLLASLTV